MYRVITASILALSIFALGFPKTDNQNTYTQLPKERRTASKLRKLPKLQDPEATALLIHLLDRYAKDVPDKSETDKLFEQELSKRKDSRETARKMMSNFRSIPLSERQAVLGKWADISAEQRIPQEQYRAAFERLAKSANTMRPATASDQHNVNRRTNVRPKNDPSDRPDKTRPGIRKERPTSNNQYVPKPNGFSLWDRNIGSESRLAAVPVSLTEPFQFPRYLLWYEGTWCHYETYSDEVFSTTDQIYVITTVTDSSGRSRILTHPISRDPQWYEFSHDDQTRVGPRVRCSTDTPGRVARRGSSSGVAAQDLALTVAVFEHDGGDPSESERLMAESLGVALFMCAAAVGGPAFLGGCIFSLAVGGLGGLLYLFATNEDDLVSVETVAISADQIRHWAGEEPLLKKGQIPYHFSTIHIGEGNADGADYHVYFTVREVPPPPVAD